MAELLVAETKSTQRIAEWSRIAIRTLAGLTAGYLVFLPVLAVVLVQLDGHIDGLRFFYGMFLPFQAPLLLSPAFRSGCVAGEIPLDVTGASLLILGVAVAFLARRRTSRREFSELSVR
jgi:hypothetical protein